jgi:hypothetical protein
MLTTENIFDRPMVCPYVWAFRKYFRLLEKNATIGRTNACEV